MTQSKQVNNTLEDAVESLEVKIAYQEDTIESLNQTVIQQQYQLDTMQRKLDALMDKVENLGDAELPINGELELPPHY